MLWLKVEIKRKMCTASIYKLKENGYIRLRMIKRYCHKDDKCENVWRPLKNWVKWEQLLRSGVYPSEEAIQSRLVSSGELWGGIRLDTNAAQRNKEEDQENSKKREISLMLSLNSRRGKNEAKTVSWNYKLNRKGKQSDGRKPSHPDRLTQMAKCGLFLSRFNLNFGG